MPDYPSGMPIDRPILLLGGAPRVRVDVIRHITVAATGTTAVALANALRNLGRSAQLMLSMDAAPTANAMRYSDRDALEEGLAAWIARNPEACVVMTAALNDYRVSRVERWDGGEVRASRLGEKLPSGADEVVIRLAPVGKVIDQLRSGFGLRGPIVGFKYEEAATVLASAETLRQRTGAACVVANSLCGTVQALLDRGGIEQMPNRDTLISTLARRITAL